jgi:8-oxo-dGTP pyrophosphatase MutT (NUDIX family)
VVAERPIEVPPPPRPWRLSARLLVVDRAERLLLIRARDQEEPDTGEWWEVPGGGVESGEDTVAAAVRETAEETGYVVQPQCVGPACWTGEVTYRWARRRWWSSMVMHLARLDAQPPRQHPDRRAGEELCFLDVCWVPVRNLPAGDRRYFPASLAADLPRLLAGERVDTGFTVWN